MRFATANGRRQQIWRGALRRTCLKDERMAQDQKAKLRNLVAGYSDSIRLSDIKANIAVLFVAIMISRLPVSEHSARWGRNQPGLCEAYS
jgi:hypothetical protein